MKPLTIDLDVIKKIAEHACKELPKGMDAQEYAEEICENVSEVIFHQQIQDAYYTGLLDATRQCNSKLDKEL